MLLDGTYTYHQSRLILTTTLLSLTLQPGIQQRAKHLQNIKCIKVANRSLKTLQGKKRLYKSCFY